MILVGPDVGHVTAWNKLAAHTNATDVGGAYHVTWGGKAALLAAVGPLALVPSSANGTRLGTVRLAYGDCSRSLVAELRD